MLLLMNLEMKSRGLCHRCHLFPGSRRQGFQGTRKCAVGGLKTLQWQCRDSAESSVFVCQVWRHEQSDILQHADPWAQNEPKSVSSAKVCLSVNFSLCSVCQELVVCIQHLPLAAHQYYILRSGAMIDCDTALTGACWMRANPPLEQLVSRDERASTTDLGHRPRSPSLASTSSNSTATPLM